MSGKRRSPTASEVSERRQELGWARQSLAKNLGVSVSVAWRIENVGPSDRKQADLVIKTLWPDLTEEDLSREDEVLTEWRGLVKGDPCRTTNLKGSLTRFRFTFVELRYSPFGSKAVVTRDDTGHTKVYPPEIIRGANGQPLAPEDD